MNNKIDNATIRQYISELYSISNTGRKAKYYRNYRRYNNTPAADIENIKDPSVVGYYQVTDSPESDTTPTPSINVVKSCVDTLTSKIAQSKVRPFFNCVNGTFKDIQLCKQSQQYFDYLFDEQDVNRTVSESFRDSAIFDTGVIYIDDERKVISRALPWQVYFRPAEKNYSKITRIYYERKDYPVTLLPESIYDKIKDKIGSTQYTTFGIYYDTFNHIKASYTPLFEDLMVEDYEPDVIPFVFLNYCSPIIGNTSPSVVDMLNSIQLEIDTLMSKIKDASQLNPANTYFVPDGSTIKVGQLSNRVGNVITYKPLPDISNPVTVSTPAFIDNQYIELVDNLVQKAYEMVGISQLSAQSKKPSGLDSGVALATIEDTESDRFETQLNQVIRCYVNIAKTCIHVFASDSDILPEDANRVSCKWKDIVEESKRMSIQFSGADSLSKDPSTKLNQLKELATAGIIPRERIAQFMQIPDLESGYSMSNNAINAVMSVIDDCIQNDEYEIPEYIPYDMLKEEILNTQLSLRAANYKRNRKDIDKLMKLYKIAEDNEAKWQASAEQQAQQAGKAEEGAIPQQQNILEKETTMTKVPQGQTADMDLSTNDGSVTGWNGRQYDQTPVNNPMTAEDGQGTNT